MTAILLLDNMEKVKEFVSIALTKPYDIDLVSGKYVINGKSIMGIFSLDLTKPVMVNADTGDDDEFALQVEKFIFENKK
jgi:phosphotransferase system HPr-like phosphotransfer protein